MHPIVVVGGGPCGLFTSFKLLTQKKDCIVTLLEANSYVGGRTRMTCYEGVSVVTGAGVIRDSDRHLKRICNRLKVPLHRFVTSVRYPYPKRQSSEIFLELLKKFEMQSDEFRNDETFSQNFKRIMGEKVYQSFTEMAGYTDYENANVWDTLADYGFEDNTSGQVMYRVDWNDLMHRLVVFLQNTNRFHLHLSTKAVRVVQQHNIEIICDKQQIFRASTLFWTTPCTGWKPIMQWLPKELYKQVQCQPFLRAYTITNDDKKYPRGVTTHTKAEYANQKVIPFSDSNICMISYSDNEHARKAVKELPSSVQKFYWPCGTHYYTPSHDKKQRRTEWLKKMQFPNKQIQLFLASEGLSRNQGWTEGAWESATEAVKIFMRQ